MEKPRKPLSDDVLAELPQRLINSAEAFYYAAILSSLPFDSSDIKLGAFGHRKAVDAAYAAISGKALPNELGSPPIVNFGLSIELFIKLLRYLGDGHLMQGHSLKTLFEELEEKVPPAAEEVIRQHIYWRGAPDEFKDDLQDVATVFENWRYAHEKPILAASHDSLFVLANAFRCALIELHPHLQSDFDHARHPGERNCDSHGRS